MEGTSAKYLTEAFCLVAQAPSADWVTPLYKYLRITGKHWDFRHAKSVAPRNRTAQDDLTAEQKRIR